MGLMNDLAGFVETVNPDELDKKIQLGTLPSEGLHHAILDGYREATANSGSHGYELTFKILAGPFKDAEVRETLWNSDKDNGKNRMMIFAHRLGLYTKTTEGGKSKYTPVPGKSDLVDCVGKEVIIDVVHREYEKKSGGKAMAANLSFEGIMSLDDKRAAKVAKAPSGSTGTTTPSGNGSGTATQQPAKSQGSFADL